MRNKGNASKTISRLAALTLIVCLVVCTILPMGVFAVNEEVTASADGVFQVNLVYRDDNNTEIRIMAGSGFLINSDTLVTCAHCVNLADSDCQAFAEMFGKTIAEIKDRLSYSVTVTRDVTIPATIQKMSVEMDFAILHLNESIQNATPLSIRPSSEVQRTEVVYAIGYPDESAIIETVRTYTSDDATITQGVVNKIDLGKNLYSGADTNYLQTSCKLTSGNSGGPMVDENGNVIGVCEGTTGTAASGDDYSYAVAIDQVTQVCDALGIMYNKAGDTAVVEPTEPVEEATEPTEPVLDSSALEAAIAEASAISADGYTEESYAAMSTALDAAKAALSSDDQSEIDNAATELTNKIDALEYQKSNNNLMIICIIVAVVVVAIVVVVILVVSGGKKKKKAAPARPAPLAAAPTPAPAAPAPVGAFAPSPMNVATGGRQSGTVSLNPEAGETTILSQDAGETTVLSANINGGSLLRLSNKSRININKAEITIGRERKRVDYCISDNTSISRVHAKLLVRDGRTYIVDMNAANGTFVNGIKAAPHQEISLKDGDKVTLAAEDFEYHS